MNVWIFVFFFAVAIGLVMLFVVGTSAGIPQTIQTADACDPFSPKPEKKPLLARPEGMTEEEYQEAMKQLFVSTGQNENEINRMFKEYYEANGDFAMAAAFEP